MLFRSGEKAYINLITNYLASQPATYPIYSCHGAIQPLPTGHITSLYIVHYEPKLRILYTPTL